MTNSSGLKTMIKELRKKSGMTQLELARMAGVGKTVIFDLEHGKESIQLDTLLKIFKALNIKVRLVHPLCECQL